MCRAETRMSSDRDTKIERLSRLRIEDRNIAMQMWGTLDQTEQQSLLELVRELSVAAQREQTASARRNPDVV